MSQSERAGTNVVPNGEHERQEEKLRDDRVAPRHRATDRGPEPLDPAGGDELSFEELREDSAAVSDEHTSSARIISGTARRNRAVCLDIDEKRDVDAAEESAVDRAEHEQREPDDSADDDNAKLDVAHDVIVEMGLAEELVEWRARMSEKS